MSNQLLNLNTYVMLKGGKLYVSTSGQFADKLDNLSCIRINEWEYIFQVTYILGGIRRLST